MNKTYLKSVTALLVVFISSLIGFISIEIYWRLENDIKITDPRNFIHAQLDMITNQSGVMDYHPKIGWVLKENLYEKDGGLTTGKYGIRMNANEISELTINSILAVGDSFTAGSGVEDNETWPAGLEELSGIDVHNGAAGAWGVDQMILRAKELVPILKPRMLLVGILTQDNLRNAYEIYGGAYKPYYEVKNNGITLKGVPVPKVVNKPIEIGLFRNVIGHSFLMHWLSMKFSPSWWIRHEHYYKKVMTDEESVDVSCLLMNDLQNMSIENDNMPIAIVIQYGAHESSGDTKAPWYIEKVNSCAEKNNIIVVDSYQILNELSNTDWDKFESLWLDEGGVLGHMSAAGNKLTAEFIYSNISQYLE